MCQQSMLRIRDFKIVDYGWLRRLRMCHARKISMRCYRRASETVCFPAISRCGEDGKNHSHWNCIFRCLLKPICRLFYSHLVSHRFSCCWTFSSFRWIAFFEGKKKTFQYSGVVPCLESSECMVFFQLVDSFFSLYRANLHAVLFAYGKW